MSYINHAKKEFYLAGWMDKDGSFECDMQELMCNQVIELLEVFASHGHSGSSYGYAVNLFEKLARFKLITPLTGDESEWVECDDGDWQNNRLSSVFKGGDGKAYDIDGRIYWEWFKGDHDKPYKSYFNKGGDRFYIEFPYEQQKPVEVFVPTDEFPHEVLS